MNKETYLTELAKFLKQLPNEEKEEILADYSDHFEAAHRAGRSIDDIVSGMGTPEIIAKEVLAQYQIRKASDSPSLNNVFRAVKVIVSLSVLNLAVVLAPFLASLFLLGCLYILSFALLASPILFLIEHHFSASFFTETFYMLGLVGFGMLGLMGAVRLTKWYCKAVLRYLKYNLKIMERRS